MNELQFYIYSLFMRVGYYVNSDEDEDHEFGDVLDLLVELGLLLLIVCSVLGAFLSILTTGYIPFERASITIFVFLCFFIWLTSA
jgi:hypothetical protein